MTCGAPHPERALACESVGTHADHAAWVKDEGHVFWPNDEYVAPPPPVPAGRGRGAAQARLHGLAQLVPPKATSATTGEQLRDDAMAAIEANTPEEFKVAARDGLRRISYSLPELTAEDVQDLIGIEAHDNRAWGPIMRWGVKEGLIAKIEPEKFIQSRYPRRHKMDVRVWKSLVHPDALVEGDA